MKKINSLLAFFFLSITTLNAQFNFSNFLDGSVHPETQIHPIGDDKYIVVECNTYTIVDKNLSVISKDELNLSKHSELVSMYGTENGSVFAIFREYDTKNEFFFYLQFHFNPEGKLVKNEELPSFEEKKKERNYSYSLTSGNGNFHAHFIFTMDKDDFLKETIVYIFDNQGDIIENRNFTPKFNNNIFSYHSGCLTDEGLLYLLFSSKQNSKGENSDKNETFHILKVNENGEELFDYNDFEFGNISSAGILQLEDDNFFISGFYTDAPQKNATNFFSMIFETEKETFNLVQTGALKEFENHTLSALEKKTDMLYPFTFNICGIFEMENTILMIAEEKRVIISNDKTIPSPQYNTRNILIFSFEKSGDIVNYNGIVKHHYNVVKDYFVNAGVLKHDNNLYILSNCIYKNHISGKELKPVNVTLPSKVGLQIFTVSEDGEIINKKLMAPIPEKCVFSEILFTGDQTVLMRYVGFKNAGTSYDIKIRQAFLD
ncbi:hypothetical protein LJC68_00730 [Bacteroidales bacterium OttesenSCG-928-B11]|nr:hypothetical protein [Bacteroidales bacterium OttesenSCG-928-C03]MDL2311388.1 hypothetical protein [Bacteroidales bacterium OttesenSCG-928-B11]MDL2325784.1 hypothetical protein [Bacteroidales bacterium OttesenSCG-928-A14]